MTVNPVNVRPTTDVHGIAHVPNGPRKGAISPTVGQDRNGPGHASPTLFPIVVPGHDGTHVPFRCATMGPMQNPTRIFMGAAAGVVVGWVVAHYDTSPVIDPLRQAAHRVRHALLYLEGGEGYEDRRHERVNVPPATAPTFEEQIRDAAMANALDQLRPTPIPVDPNPEPVEVRDPFDHVLLPDPPPIAPTFDDPPVDPWFRPITTPDLPESVMDPDAEFLGGDGDALMFMLPDGTSATAEEYMDRLDRDTGREQL